MVSAAAFENFNDALPIQNRLTVTVVGDLKFHIVGLDSPSVNQKS